MRVMVVGQGETNLPEVVLAFHFGRTSDASAYSEYDARGECYGNKCEQKYSTSIPQLLILVC
jgi:hypothetical protein